MKELSAEVFFNLGKYKHSSLFKDQNFVWKALHLLENYLQSLKLGQIEIDLPIGAFLVDPHLISIGKGSVVEPGAYIKGPCFIGNNCTIRHGAYIRGNLITGNGCVIGHDTEIKNAILLDDVHAAHFAYVGDTILGNRVNLGAGTKCANLKFNRTQTISVDYQGQVIDTGFRKFGAIFGDDTQTGCNVVTNPGTILGKNVNCSPAMSIKGVIPAHSFVTNNLMQIVTSKSKYE